MTKEQAVFESEENIEKLTVENPDIDGEIPFTVYHGNESHTIYLTKEEALNLVKFLIKFL